MTTDPLFEAVDTLSSLLKRLWKLRQYSGTTIDQIEEVDQLVDKTVVTIMSLLRMVRETGPSQRRISMNTSPAVRKAFS
jgi:hypothetical protein